MADELKRAVFDLYPARPKLAILMSGAGSNAASILDSTELRDLYDITTVVTDNQTSNARQIAEQHGLELLLEHKVAFTQRAEREAYFQELTAQLGARGVQGIVYAGFMKITPAIFANRFPGVNIHPADLRIKDETGMPVYRGMDALPRMRQDVGYVQSTVHVVDTPVDAGARIALTQPLEVSPGLTDTEAHNALKVLENYVFPKTLCLIGSGELKYEDEPPILRRPEETL